MLKKLGWALVALMLLVGLARAAGDGAGGMSINSLSMNITTALTNLSTAITTAITGSSIATGTASSPSSQTLSVVPPVGSPSFPTAPQASAPNLSGTGTISAQGGFVSISTGTLPSLGVQISGTFVATLTATCSNDNDVTAPVAKSFLVPGSAASATASAAAVSAPGNYAVLPGACDHIRITATSWTSGTITVTWVQTGASFENRVAAPIAAPLADSEVGSQNPAAGLVPAFSTATGSASSNGVIAKAAPGNLYDATAVNTSSTPGYLVVLNLAAVPASAASITPLDFRPLYAGSATAPSFAEIDAKPGLSCTVGCVAVISASLTAYQPTLTGAVAARAR